MRRKHPVINGLAFTAFVFGLLFWGYVVVIQVIHPFWVTEPFSRLRFFPFDWRLDEAGITAFAVAAVGFVVWQIELNTRTKP